MYPVHHGGGNHFHTPNFHLIFGEPFAHSFRVIAEAPLSQHLMTFNVSFSLGLPFVRPGTVARILFAFFALVAASSGTQAQPAVATPAASPSASPASSNPISAPTPATAGADAKTASSGRTVLRQDVVAVPQELLSQRRTGVNTTRVSGWVQPQRAVSVRPIRFTRMALTSLPEPRSEEKVRIAPGKASPFRTSGGRAAIAELRGGSGGPRMG